jgi:hypothetical protein
MKMGKISDETFLQKFPSSCINHNSWRGNGTSVFELVSSLRITRRTEHNPNWNAKLTGGPAHSETPQCRNQKNNTAYRSDKSRMRVGEKRPTYNTSLVIFTLHGHHFIRHGRRLERWAIISSAVPNICTSRDSDKLMSSTSKSYKYRAFYDQSTWCNLAKVPKVNNV